MIILIGGHIIRAVRPHEDIPEHGIIPLPVKDVHRVLTILKLFGMTLLVTSPGPSPGRSDIFFKNSVISVVERCCSIPPGKGWAWGNVCVIWVSLHEHIIRLIAWIDFPCPEIPGTCLAVSCADIECPANHAAGAA